MEEAVEEAAAYLTANAISGTTHTKSIRLRALVGNQVMLLLVDSGSSHTFIDQQLVNKLKCNKTQLSKTLKVKVANGETMLCDTEVTGLEWWIQGETFTTDMKVVPLGGYDAILGMDWLSQWGEMTCHWQEQWIKFKKDGQEVQLQGLKTVKATQLQEMSVEQVEKSVKGNDIWDTAVVSFAVQKDGTTVPQIIPTTLDSFQDVFQDPKTLPPHRAFDHAISLLPDSAPVNARPYRYSPQQKDEIE